jgi:predicted nuclease of predicted toxin-antitoxin system
MIRLFIDQDLDHDILRGLERRIPNLDAITAYEAGLSEAADPELLEWAAEAGRIVVTHDRKTMPSHATDRIEAGEKMAGLIVISRQLPINQVIDNLEMIVVCNLEHEWENVIRYLPL